MPDRTAESDRRIDELPGIPLVQSLQALVHEKGLLESSKELGITHAELYKLCRKYGIRQKTAHEILEDKFLLSNQILEIGRINQPSVNPIKEFLYGCVGNVAVLALILTVGFIMTSFSIFYNEVEKRKQEIAGTTQAKNGFDASRIPSKGPEYASWFKDKDLLFVFLAPPQISKMKNYSEGEKSAAADIYNLLNSYLDRTIAFTYIEHEWNGKSSDIIGILGQTNADVCFIFQTKSRSLIAIQTHPFKVISRQVVDTSVIQPGYRIAQPGGKTKLQMHDHSVLEQKALARDTALRRSVIEVLEQTSKGNDGGL